MKPLPPIIELAKPKLIPLQTKYKISSLYVFGSVLGDKFNDESDLDFLVEFENVPLLDYADNFFDLEEELQAIFQRKIHLTIEKSIKNPILRESINREKILIYN